MKKYITIKIGILLLALIGLQACESILDQEPLGIATPENYWNSQANAESAIAGCYGLYKAAMTNEADFLKWGEFPARTFMDSKMWIVDYIEGGNFVPAYSEESRDWRSFYKITNWASIIEKHVGEMPDNVFDSKQDKDRIIGEAAFLRALAYFNLARIWGDVPLVKNPIETANQLINDGSIEKLSRTNEKEVLKFALEEVNKSISLLSYSTPASPNWAIRANKASAEALKAHITLWYASRDNDNLALINQCISSANSIIANSGASLINYVTEKKEGFDKMCIGQSKTSLFEINISAGDKESFRITPNSFSNNYPSLTLNKPFFKDSNDDAPAITGDGYGKDFMNSDPDRDNDKRKELFFYNYDTDEDTYLLKYSHTSPDSQVKNDPYAFFSESNILIFRLADVYLLRAEAYMRLGNAAAAVADINAIRSRANVPNYTGPTDREGLTKAIFEERAIEFVGEGQAAFDRIRLKYFNGVDWMNTDRINNGGYFWPVKPSIIIDNPAITQTPFWKGKVI